MPLKPKLVPRNGVEMRCGEIAVYDTTGAHDPSSNLTGWGDGTTNPLYTAVTAVAGKVTFSNGYIYLGSLYNPVTPFPNINSAPFVLTTAMMGGNAPVDGKVTIEAEVTGDFGGSIGFLGKSVESGFITCNVFCCIQKLMPVEEYHMDPCNSAEWKLYNKAKKLWYGMQHLIDCRKWDKATVVLKDLEELCLSNNADCGC